MPGSEVSGWAAGQAGRWRSRWIVAHSDPRSSSSGT
jgi:hypothetical protein